MFTLGGQGYVCLPVHAPPLQVMLHGEERSGFILSGHTATQLKAIDQLSSTTPDTCGLVLHVEGPHRIWINKSPVQYFSLRLDAKDSTNDDEGEMLVLNMHLQEPH